MRPIAYCSVDECTTRCYSNGLCQRHFWRWKRHGSTELLPTPQLQFTMDSLSAPDGVDDPCVVWPYGAHRDGHGKPIVWEHGKDSPHVITCILRHGSRPSGMLACHGPCHEPRCLVHVSWQTPKQNTADRKRDGTQPRGKDRPTAVLTDEQVREIVALRATGLSQEKIARQFGINQTNVGFILRGKTWSHVTGIGAQNG